MPYGILAEVRKLSGNPPTAEIADTDITTYIDGADSIINTITGKTDWAAADAEYEAIETASNLYAAATILDHFQDKEGKAQAFRKEFWQILAPLRTQRGDMFGLTKRTE